MKCLNCGGTEFEKAEFEGQFTTPFSYRSKFGWSASEKTVIVPRYFHACLSCGLVHQILDLEVRRKEMKNLIEFAIEDQLTEPNDERDAPVIERVSCKEMSEMTKIPRPLLDELVKEVLEGHKGYSTIQIIDNCDRIIPVLREDDGDRWIVGKKE